MKTCQALFRIDEFVKARVLQSYQPINKGSAVKTAVILHLIRPCTDALRGQQVRGVSSPPRPSQNVATETEFLNMLMGEIERMPETLKELQK